MEDSIKDPLGTLFEQFLKDRVYLKAVTARNQRPVGGRLEGFQRL
jgi:hypothetical protein